MTRTFKGLTGEQYEAEFNEHDISPYDVLFHVTGKDRRTSIEEKGLLLYQPTRKTLGDPLGLLFMSYPIDMDTSDCFRWYDDSCSLIVLDAKTLKRDGFIFYDDWWGRMDQSSKRNHLMVDKEIPTQYIKKIIEY